MLIRTYFISRQIQWNLDNSNLKGPDKYLQISKNLNLKKSVINRAKTINNSYFYQNSLLQIDTLCM